MWKLMFTERKKKLIKWKKIILKKLRVWWMTKNVIFANLCSTMEICGGKGVQLICSSLWIVCFVCVAAESLVLCSELWRRCSRRSNQFMLISACPVPRWKGDVTVRVACCTDWFWCWRGFWRLCRKIFLARCCWLLRQKIRNGVITHSWLINEGKYEKKKKNSMALCLRHSLPGF